MRTTIEVPDPVFRTMKAHCARSGKTMKEFALRAIEKELAASRQQEPKRVTAKLPLVRSAKPGSLRTMSNAEIEDLLG